MRKAAMSKWSMTDGQHLPICGPTPLASPPWVRPLQPSTQNLFLQNDIHASSNFLLFLVHSGEEQTLLQYNCGSNGEHTRNSHEILSNRPQLERLDNVKWISRADEAPSEEDNHHRNQDTSH